MIVAFHLICPYRLLLPHLPICNYIQHVCPATQTGRELFSCQITCYDWLQMPDSLHAISAETSSKFNLSICLFFVCFFFFFSLDVSDYFFPSSLSIPLLHFFFLFFCFSYYLSLIYILLCLLFVPCTLFLFPPRLQFPIALNTLTVSTSEK